MEKTLKVLNELEKQGIIKRYAIGGGIATLFYTEPILTYDMDVFVFLPASRSKLVLLSPLYGYLREKGYREDKEHVIIRGKIQAGQNEGASTRTLTCHHASDGSTQRQGQDDLIPRGNKNESGRVDQNY